MQSQSFILTNGYSLIILIILCIIFFGKERLHNIEDNLYAKLLIICLITISVGVFLGASVTYKLIPLVICNYLSKIYLSGLVALIAQFVFYGFCISNKREISLTKIDKFINCYCIINLIISLILPADISISDSGMYSQGIIAFYSFGTIFVFYVLLLIIIFKNIRELGQKKYIPLIMLVIEIILLTVITMIYPENNFAINPVMVVNCLIMYFTIENPDVRLVEYEKKEKELAVSANEAKSAFLSSMSHELRTPLNAIVGLSEDMLSYKDRVPNEVKEDCDDIVNASNTLLEIIGNILDISKIEGGKLELIESDYLPKEEIESLLKIMRTKVEEKDLKFNVFIDPNIPECLYGDRLRIKQIINNFLSNAIKYTEKGSIDFGARWVNNCLELKVRDTGRGIKKEDMDKLFEKFERLHVEKTSAVQGTGLGLAITKNLINLMGGTISVDSEFGVGSTFDVVIPQKIGNKDNIVREALTVEEKHDVDFTGKKLLVVDDNKLNIKVLRKAIASFNFEIDECYNGEEALKMIGEKPYDLILMDIMMPVMGGEETLGILKQNPEFKTPVIALTADATTGAKEKYLSVGFVDYLTKPFSRDTIATKLEKVFEDTK